MKIDEKSKRELICKECGFMTFGYKDMVEHLAQYVCERGYRRIPEENCSTQRIEFGKYFSQVLIRKPSKKLKKLLKESVKVA